MQYKDTFFNRCSVVVIFPFRHDEKSLENPHGSREVLIPWPVVWECATAHHSSGYKAPRYGTRDVLGHVWPMRSVELGERSAGARSMRVRSSGLLAGNGTRFRSVRYIQQPVEAEGGVSSQPICAWLPRSTITSRALGDPVNTSTANIPQTVRNPYRGTL